MAGLSERIVLEREKRQLLQHAYDTGVLSAGQFGELEELQAESPTFIQEVSQTFAEEVPAMLSDLQRVLLSGGEPDMKTAREVLHKLKGSAVTLGAAAVAECCAAVRNHCVAGTLAPIGAGADTPGSLEALKQSLVIVQDTLARYVSLDARLCALTD